MIVILNSNTVKTKAFKKILNNYDTKAVEEFIDYHKKWRDLRYEKLDYFLKIYILNILKISMQIKST